MCKSSILMNKSVQQRLGQEMWSSPRTWMKHCRLLLTQGNTFEAHILFSKDKKKDWSQQRWKHIKYFVFSGPCFVLLWAPNKLEEGISFKLKCYKIIGFFCFFFSNISSQACIPVSPVPRQHSYHHHWSSKNSEVSVRWKAERCLSRLLRLTDSSPHRYWTMPNYWSGLVGAGWGTGGAPGPLGSKWVRENIAGFTFSDRLW